MSVCMWRCTNNVLSTGYAISNDWEWVNITIACNCVVHKMPSRCNKITTAAAAGENEMNPSKYRMRFSLACDSCVQLARDRRVRQNTPHYSVCSAHFVFNHLSVNIHCICIYISVRAQCNALSAQDISECSFFVLTFLSFSGGCHQSVHYYCSDSIVSNVVTPYFFIIIIYFVFFFAILCIYVLCTLNDFVHLKCMVWRLSLSLYSSIWLVESNRLLLSFNHSLSMYNIQIYHTR